MKSFTPIFTILALASAHQIYFSQHNSEHQPTFNYQTLPGYKVSAFTQPSHGVSSQNQGYSSQNQGFSNQGYSGQSQHKGFSFGNSHGLETQSGHDDKQEISREGSAKILHNQYENNDHSYQYAYETDNGIKAQEHGQVQGKSLAVQGEYSYTGKDGQVYTVSYVADENGFRPSGAHLPTPPPIPEAIQKSLEVVGHEETNGQYDDSQYHDQYQGEQNYQQYDNHYEASLSGLRAPSASAGGYSEGW